MATTGESSKALIPPAMDLSPPDDPQTIPPSTLFRPSQFLDRLVKWLNHLVGTDQLIMLIQYTLEVVTHHMDSNTPFKLMVILNKYLPFFSHPHVKLASSPSPLSTRLKSLSLKLADTRILLRLHGIIPTYQWFLSTHYSPPSDPTLATVAKLQTYANLCYFPLENAAYLGMHDILPMSKRTETDLWLWSSRFWAAHVALEFVRLWRERVIKSKGKGKEKMEEREAWDKRWWGSLIMNLAYAPQTVHWSVEGGVFSDIHIAYCGVIAALASIYLGFPTS